MHVWIRNIAAATAGYLHQLVNDEYIESCIPDQLAAASQLIQDGDKYVMAN